MASGKTIKVYLVDGTPNGLQTVELSNWTGKGVVCQRAQLPLLAKRPEARRTGVYILSGPDPEMPSRDCAYIGEGDSVLDRLIKHDQDPDKDFWTSAVAFTSKDENLTKAHVRYLEAELIRRAAAAGRVKLINQTRPETKQLPEPDVADMSEQRLVPEVDGRLLRFTEDVAFKSPSAAASVVFGGNQNGPMVWKIRGTTTTYKQWKDAKVRHAEEEVAPRG